MLRNKESVKERGNSGFGSSNTTTLVAAGTEVVGNIKFGGHLDIEGIVRGNVDAVTEEDAMVRIVDRGRVEGEIHAPSVVINGIITGDVYASKHLELASKARVRGNIYYTKMEMCIGAEVEGNLKYGGGDSSREVSKADRSPSKGGPQGAAPSRSSSSQSGGSSSQGAANQPPSGGGAAPQDAKVAKG